MEAGGGLLVQKPTNDTTSPGLEHARAGTSDFAAVWLVSRLNDTNNFKRT